VIRVVVLGVQIFTDEVFLASSLWHFALFYCTLCCGGLVCILGNCALAVG